MTERVRVRLRGTVPVPLPPAAACELFTPEGERAWAVGWDPRYPAAAVRALDPGTVFLTEPGRPTTWVCVGYAPGREVAYARVSGTATAGTVRVRCAEAVDGTTLVEVAYDLTALAPDADAELEAFAARFDDYLEHWRLAIGAALRSGAAAG